MKLIKIGVIKMAFVQPDNTPRGNGNGNGAPAEPGRELRPPDPMVEFRRDVKSMEKQFSAALPVHVPAERFSRALMTCVNRNPDLLRCDRASLFNAVMQSAQAGLLPDGKECAIVAYGRDATFLPMVYGILKMVRNSGQLSSIVARVVYAGDKFRNWIDDQGEHIEFEASETGDRSAVRLVFAMARLKDGSIEVEPLLPIDIEKIRDVSRAKKGPWFDWWEEMAKKSALKRLCKRLPISSDLDDLIRNDEHLYDRVEKDGVAVLSPGDRAKGTGAKLDALLGGKAAGPIDTVDPKTGEIVDYVAASSEGRLNGVVDSESRASEAYGAGDADPGSHRGSQEGAGPDSSPPAQGSAPTDHEALVADLLATGRSAALGGEVEFRAYLDGLTKSEKAAIPKEDMAAMLKAARAASAPA